MSATAAHAVAIRQPEGEALPLVLWLDGEAPVLAAEASALGATVVTTSAVHALGDAPPPLLDALATEHRERYGRCYLVHAHTAAVAALRAGVPGTRLHDADPWAVALVLGAVRDAGCRPEIDREARGGGTTDELQGFTLHVPPGQGACVAAAIAALADGLRVSKC